MATTGNNLDSALTRLGSAELEFAFEELIYLHARQMNEIGFTSETPTQEAKRTFAALSHARQQTVLEDLFSTTQLIQDARMQPERFLVSSADLTLSQEVNYLQMFLFRRKLRLVDSAILDLIEEGDVIEIYDHRAIQLYRSWSFFKFCSYSLVDLLLHDWNELYSRPTWVVSKLFETAPRLFAPGAKTIAYELPEYLISERLNHQRRSMLFKMKFASPLVDPVTSQTTCFITTGTLKLLSCSEKRPQVEFL